jgi:hypothetical protein
MSNSSLYDYTIFIYNFLAQSSLVYLLHDIPEKHLLAAGLVQNLHKFRISRKKHIKSKKKYADPLSNICIDMLQIHNDEYIYIKCVDKDNIHTAIHAFDKSLSHLNQNNIKGKLVAQNKAVFDNKFITKNNKIDFVVQDMDKKLIFDKHNIIDQNPIDILEKYLDINNRCILPIFDISAQIARIDYLFNSYFNLIIVSTRAQYSEYFRDIFTAYDKNIVGHVVHNAANALNNISNFITINKGKKKLFCITYDSVHILNQFIHRLKKTIVIFTEFHNLLKKNLFDKNDPIFKLLNSDNMIIFQSITPKIYNSEHILQKKIFGDNEYSVAMKQIFKDEYVRDYKIYVPVTEESFRKIKNRIREYNIDILNDTITYYCIYLLTCMSYHGSKKCVVFCDKKQMKQIKNILLQLDKYYLLYLHVYTVSANNNYNADQGSNKSIKYKINEFSNSDRCIILTDDILNYCIKVDKCDSVFFACSNQNKNGIIQKMFRFFNKSLDKNNLYRIYIWCNHYNELGTILNELTEYDSSFDDKIFVQSCNIFENNNLTNENILNSNDLLFDYIFENDENNEQTWTSYLDRAKKFIILYKKTPSINDNDHETKKLGKWFYIQMTNYLNNKLNVLYYDSWVQFIEDKAFNSFIKFDIDNEQKTFEKDIKIIFNKWNKSLKHYKHIIDMEELEFDKYVKYVGKQLKKLTVGVLHDFDYDEKTESYILTLINPSQKDIVWQINSADNYIFQTATKQPKILRKKTVRTLIQSRLMTENDFLQN